ncbi:MAG: hypothetical protein HYS33_04250 [Acidobacteria bacterium]|nr:hypothetical protein [Acidobacteriota bacterium]
MWEYLPPQFRLRGAPRLDERSARRLASDFDKFRDGLPHPLEGHVLSAYGIDLTSDYGGLKLRNPFGKASGQLSLARHQVEKDAEANLGFVVLKTVIAQDRAGEQTMHEWAIPETRMLVERIRGRGGVQGWTVTWKGRGWFDTFEAYLRLFDEALTVGGGAAMPVVPSIKYHLPTPDENFWKEEEYTFTTAALVGIWEKHHGARPMPLEKDFSPTLAGSERAAQQAKILEWLRTVSGLIHGAASGRVSVGLKIFNTLFEDSFQVRMLDAVHAIPQGEERCEFLIYANRLFDPAKSFEDKTGVAYGGPDLSDRNLATLEGFLNAQSESPGGFELLPVSATGDIHSGRLAAEYLLRGASSFQMHTLFQLPDGEFAMRSGSKTEKALHHLLFHPEEGFLAWILDLRARFGWKAEANIREMAEWCQKNWKAVAESLCRET